MGPSRHQTFFRQPILSRNKGLHHSDKPAERSANPDNYRCPELPCDYLVNGGKLVPSKQQHPVSYRIQVRSGEWAIDNPSVDKYEILGLTSDQGVCN